LTQTKGKSTVREINAEFFANTSAHGFAHVFEETAEDDNFHIVKKLWRKTLWTFIVTILVAVTMYLTVQLLLEYGQKPTKTTVEITSQPNVRFPDVTICPLNGFKLSSIADPDRVTNKYETSMLKSTWLNYGFLDDDGKNRSWPPHCDWFKETARCSDTSTGCPKVDQRSWERGDWAQLFDEIQFDMPNDDEMNR
jgi:hypothetical protein